MSIMISVGIVLTLLGLAGLIYCMVSAFRARKSGLVGEQLTHHLRSLVAINIGSFFLSAIGLACVIVGMLL